MTKTTSTSCSILQPCNRLEEGMTNWSQNKLGNAVTAMNREWLFAKVNQSDFDFTPIIGINCARRVDKGNTMFNG